MLLKNNSKRLITINEPLDTDKDKEGNIIGATAGAAYNLMPAGPAVSVPDSLCESRYVKALIELGEVLISEDEAEDEEEGDEFDLAKMTKAELVAFAEENKIEVNSGDVKATILAAIEEHIAA